MLSQSTSQSSLRKPHVPESPSLYAEIDKVVTRIAVGLLITSGCGLGALIALSASSTLPFLWPAVGVLVGFAVVGVIAIIASEVLRSKDRALRKVNKDIHILTQELLEKSEFMVTEALILRLSPEITSLANDARQIGQDAQANSRRSLVLDDAYNQKSKLIGLGRQLEAISKKLEEQSNQEDKQESFFRKNPTPRATGMRQGAWFPK